MTDAQLDRLDAWCADRMGRGGETIIPYVTETYFPPDTNAPAKKRTALGDQQLCFRPTHDAAAAAELRKAMVVDAERVWVEYLGLKELNNPGKVICVRYGLGDSYDSCCSVADNENLATVLCFIRFNGGDPDKIAGSP